MDTKKIFLTKQGFEELEKELNELSSVKRPEVVKRVSDARDQGDLSENAEYTAAREELSFIDGRIEELEELIKGAVIIQDEKQGSHQKINLGSKVVVRIDGKKEEYSVVGEFEADPLQKKISHESPLGKALLGRKVGEEVKVEAPAGSIIYKIVSIN